MSSAVGKKIGDTTLKRICDGLKRRSTSCVQKLLISDGVNVDRVSDFILYKSCKEYAMKNFGMRLDDFESVKEHAGRVCRLNKAEPATTAFETIRMYSRGIAVEKIADAAFKASKILNWSCEKKRTWGNIADLGFKPSNRTRKSDSRAPIKYDLCARDNYVVEASGISEIDFGLLEYYATHVYKIWPAEARTMAGQVIVIEKIINAAFNASQNLSLCSRQEEPTEATDNTATPDQEISSELTPIIDDTHMQPWEDKFMESRDVMSIFMDSDEARERYTRLRSTWTSTSSSIKDWTRITRFMEFKARKEYAMEAYGVRLGDFQSLKKAALMLFEITEAEAENLASETMASDSESIAFEKIADVAFKASKILNWTANKKKKHSKTWHGDIADAGGFKSPQSMKNYRKNMDMEACKAYTMEAFGVSLVDIDILKHFAISMFRTYVREDLSEQEAVIMACQTVAIDKIVDALSENLNLTFQVEGEEAKKDSRLPKHWALIYPGTVVTIFSLPPNFFD